MDLLWTKVKNEIESKSDKPAFFRYEKLQKLAFAIMKKESPAKIGGHRHVVEIDESKFSKIKYKVGRSIRSPCVVLGIDLTTNDPFFVEVTRRDGDTRNNIILKRVKIGSVLYRINGGVTGG